MLHHSCRAPLLEVKPGKYQNYSSRRLIARKVKHNFAQRSLMMGAVDIIGSLGIILFRPLILLIISRLS